MARFYGLKIKAGELTIEKVPRLWRTAAEKWLQADSEEGR